MHFYSTFQKMRKKHYIPSDYFQTFGKNSRKIRKKYLKCDKNTNLLVIKQKYPIVSSKYVKIYRTFQKIKILQYFLKIEL